MQTRNRALNPGADVGLLLLVVIWGVNFAVVKAAMAEFQPLAFNALRFPLAALVLWAFMRRMGPGVVLEPGHRWRVLVLGFVGHGLYQVCFIYALAWTSAGNASLLLSTTPVWTALLSRAMGHERIPGRAWAGIVGTILGMALVVGGAPTGAPGGGTLQGDLLMVVASLLWSSYTVGSHALVRRYGAVRSTAWTLWAGTPLVVALGMPEVVKLNPTAVAWPAWLGVVYAGALSVGLAYVLWYRGVGRIGNSRTAVYSNLVPVVALLTAWLWLGERPTGPQVVGAAVIIGGLTAARLAQETPPESRRGR